jgi:hypothetical protein
MQLLHIQRQLEKWAVSTPSNCEFQPQVRWIRGCQRNTAAVAGGDLHGALGVILFPLVVVERVFLCSIRTIAKSIRILGLKVRIKVQGIHCHQNRSNNPMVQLAVIQPGCGEDDD